MLLIQFDKFSNIFCLFIVVKPNETISFDSDRRILTPEHQPIGEIIKEKSDICRLQDEDFCSRVNEIESGEHHVIDESGNYQHQKSISEYDSVVHSDSKLGRLHLSRRYDEQSQLIIRIIDAQVGNDDIEKDTEKQERIIVENASVQWKEPVIFCIPYKEVIKQKLYILVANCTDPSVPRDRGVCIPWNNFNFHAKEINKWFNLQFVNSA